MRAVSYRAVTVKTEIPLVESWAAAMKKSPLHRSALELKDIHTNVSYIRYDATTHTVVERGTFKGMPESVAGPDGRSRLRARVLTATGEQKLVFMSSMGICTGPNGRWNKTTFTVRAQAQHLLPTPANE